MNEKTFCRICLQETEIKRKEDGWIHHWCESCEITWVEEEKTGRFKLLKEEPDG